ncbi:EscN/YscN/HrcN family type III secretion system ATPase, partial [Escherichia coli]|nr:EscN/YscN/HrcN family type III secretion system ATPase [Escherichia coli]
MKKLKLLNKYSYLHSINGSLIEAELDDVSVGEVCEIYASRQANERIARAQVVGFRNGKTLLNLIGSSVGLTRTAVLKPTGEQLTIQISDAFLGSVLNASGQIMERFVPDTPGDRGNLRLIDELPPSYQERRVINTPLETRIRVIDGVLTCGIGQRVGIFASAGCGKTVL